MQFLNCCMINISYRTLCEEEVAMVYNFNLGIGWASSGVEYAQAYRAKVLRSIGQEAKFVFTDMFPKEIIQHIILAF